METCWQHVETGRATLVTDTDREIHADRRRLQQLFENLLRNAVDHGGPDVTVTIGDLDDGSGFYVADDGPGIPAASGESIFDAGYSTSESGYGLGLHIVKETVDAHGWSITVTQSDAGRARFEISGLTAE